MPSGKREAATFHELAALAAGQPAEIRQRRMGAESTLAAVRSRLGAPGTYDMPGTEQLGLTGQQDPYYGTEISKQDPSAPWYMGKETAVGGKEGIFEMQKTRGAGAQAIDPRYTSFESLQKAGVLDPAKYTAQLEKSAEFRIVSHLMAESEQMLKREGPLWDEMIKNTQLPIIEGASAMARENAENVRKAMQRGGAARRAGFEFVERARAQEKINTVKIQALSENRLKIDMWARDNARTNVEFAANWSKNLAGIREEFNASMDNASALMLGSALPIMFAAKQEAAEWRYYAHAKNRNKVNRWISGALGLAGMAVGGITKSAGIFGAGTSMLGGAFGGPTSPAGQ